MKRLCSLVALVTISGVAASARCQTVNLSDLLGAPSGTATCLPNAPFTEIVVCSPYGFGVNCPGSFASSLIQFSDTSPFVRGIGMHPPSNGSATLRFDLDAVRNQFHREPLMVTSRVGIDIPTQGGNNGATFNFIVDGVVRGTQTIPNGPFGSVVVQAPTEAGRFLDLQTTRSGDYNGNHAAFGDPQLVLGPDCPVPALASGAPSSRTTCPTGSAAFSVDARYWGPFAFQWQREVAPGSNNFVALTNGSTNAWDGGGPEGDPRIGAIITGADTPTMSIAPDTARHRKLAPSHAVRFRCVVSNMCGGRTSDAAQLTVTCPTDFNCDGLVNSQDFFDFLGAFFVSAPNADFNGDGLINSQDFFDYLGQFFAGC